MYRWELDPAPEPATALESVTHALKLLLDGEEWEAVRARAATRLGNAVALRSALELRPELEMQVTQALMDAGVLTSSNLGREWADKNFSEWFQSSYRAVTDHLQIGYMHACFSTSTAAM